MKTSLIQARIDATEAMILVYEAAILALGTAGIQSYKLDTGQSAQTVTRLDLVGLNRTLDSLYNRCAMFEARLNGASILAKPAW